MKHKTAELEGDGLNYCVECAIRGERPLVSVAAWSAGNDYGWNPSRNWDQGGPIIEHNDWLLPYRSPGHLLHLGMYTSQTPGGFEYSGPTPLIAAMRAFVASKLGGEVELP